MEGRRGVRVKRGWRRGEERREGMAGVGEGEEEKKGGGGAVKLGEGAQGVGRRRSDAPSSLSTGLEGRGATGARMNPSLSAYPAQPPPKGGSLRPCLLRESH